MKKAMAINPNAIREYITTRGDFIFMINVRGMGI